MNKILLLAGGCLLALGMQAQPKMTLSNVRVNNAPIAMGNTHLSQALGRANSAKVAKRATESPISDTPAGKAFENMYVTSSAYGMGFGYIYSQEVDGGLGGVVEGNDGYVYVKAPISQAYVWMLGTPWLKCTKAAGDTIVANLCC